MTDTQELSALADQHLPPQTAARWKSLLRPAIQFDWVGGSDPVAAQLGGDPELPESEPWPEWEGRGPLTFVAAFDCARVSVPALPLPESGHLLFFYFDGQVPGGTAVGAFAPGTQGGARVLYVPAGAAVHRRAAPDPIKPYGRQLLRAGAVATAPEPDGARIAAAFGDRAARGTAHPLDAESFTEAVYEEVSVGVCHQVGGYPLSIQWPVEYEIAAAAARQSGFGPSAADADRWLLLAQIDTDDDSGMMWGDAGTLYWLIQEDDLVERRFDRAVFTWQCA